MRTVADKISGQRNSQSHNGPFQGSEEERAKLAEAARIELGLPEGTPIDVIRAKYIEQDEREYRAKWATQNKQQEADEAARRKSDRIHDCWRASYCPERHRSKAETFIDPQPWLAKKAVAWEIVRNGGMVALIGSRGNGKTQLAVDLIRHACNDDKTGRYLKAMDFFIEVRASFKKESEDDESTILREYQKPWLLVIDNVDRRGSSEWEDRLLTHLIDKRYDLGVGTILIANLDPTAFAEHVGADIVDRIRDGGGLIVADWPGFRGVSA
jgi:DNA replication protein DnaC